MSLFCLDTSALIEPWVRLYPPDVFAAYWRELDRLIEAGQVIAPDEVLRELEREEDDLHQWGKEHMTIFVPPEPEVQRAVSEILAHPTHQRIVMAGGRRSAADPWVIALAKVREGKVISEEGPGSEMRPKIPTICTDLGIPCGKVLDLIRDAGLTFN